jgi:hypothetical protein
MTAGITRSRSSGAFPVPRPGAADASGRNDYSRILGQRLLQLAERVQRSPGNPDLRRALNDALHEARHNPHAVVSGEALSRAMHALARSRGRTHGPPTSVGAPLLRQIDPLSTRNAYSQTVEARLRDALRVYGVAPAADTRRRLNDVLHEARHGTAVVSLEALTLAGRALARGAPAVRPPVTQMADLSSAPGGQGLGNYVGIESRVAGRRTLVQARLRAHLELGPDAQWQIRRIEAVGPQVTQDGRVLSARDKVYVVQDAQGRPIIDPAAARARVRQMLHYQAITPQPAAGATRSRHPAPAAEPGALQPFFGAHLGTPAAERALSSLPGVGRMLDSARGLLRGAAPGVVVFFPQPKTLFVTSKDSIIGIVPGMPLKPIVTVGPGRNSPQLGIGNAGPVKGRDTDFWFWNTRITPDGASAVVNRSLAQPGQPLVMGTVNAGILTKPQCISGAKEGGAASALAAGVGFQAQLVAQDGQVYFRSGPITLPPAVFQAVLSAAGGALSGSTALGCRSGQAAQWVATLASNIRSRVSGQLSADAIQRHATGIAALAAALAAAALGDMAPQMAH